MSFKQFLFGKESSDIMRATYVIICLSVLFFFTADLGTDFNPPENDTPTHYYSVQRPDPTRQIDYFDHAEQRFRYMDERKPSTQVRSPEPRAVRRTPRRHRLFDELMDEVKEDIRDEIIMDMD